MSAPTLAPSVPALYSTVTNVHTGDVGLVRAEPVIYPGITTVQVEWDHTHEYGVTEVDIDDLLTDYGRCDHGGLAGSPDRCDADTAPGHDLCDAHGGASPIHVEVRRA